MRFKRLLVAVFAITSFAAEAQKKDFDYSELLKNKLPKNFSNPLDTVARWIDDEHFVLKRRVHRDSSARNYIMDLKTGTFTETAGGATTSRG
ncbi:MAG TPA: hypothetical protein VF622_16610, partial [Segetibacter sp.]